MLKSFKETNAKLTKKISKLWTKKFYTNCTRLVMADILASRPPVIIQIKHFDIQGNLSGGRTIS